MSIHPKVIWRILPKGATALDFAYSIHTDLGYHCTGIKVNNRLVPMGHRLEHGDQVQILPISDKTIRRLAQISRNR